MRLLANGWRRRAGAGALVLALSLAAVAGHDAALAATRRAVLGALAGPDAGAALQAAAPSGTPGGALRRLACRIARSLPMPAWLPCRPG
jgi:hypothetical protein